MGQITETPHRSTGISDFRATQTEPQSSLRTAMKTEYEVYSKNMVNAFGSSQIKRGRRA